MELNSEWEKIINLAFTNMSQYWRLLSLSSTRSRGSRLTLGWLCTIISSQRYLILYVIFYALWYYDTEDSMFTVLWKEPWWAEHFLLELLNLLEVFRFFLRIWWFRSQLRLILGKLACLERHYQSWYTQQGKNFFICISIFKYSSI